MRLAVRVLIVVSISAIVGTLIVSSSDGTLAPDSTPDGIASTIPPDDSPSHQPSPDESAPFDHEPKERHLQPPPNRHPDGPKTQQEFLSPNNEKHDRAWKDLTPKEQKDRARVRRTLKNWFGPVAFQGGRDGKPFAPPEINDPFVIAHARSQWIKGRNKRRIDIKILNEQRRRHGLPPLTGDREQDLADAKARATAVKSARSYVGVRTGHWVRKNIANGQFIILEDNSLWEIDPFQRLDASLWLPLSNITVIPSSEGSLGYGYLLINTSDGEMAHARHRGNQN